MSTTVGIGVIGLGFMGRTHVAAWNAAAADGLDCKLVAVCDQDEERRAGKAAVAGNIDAGGEA